MTEFLLIRHGNTDAAGRQLAGRAAGVALNSQGRAQAQRLVSRLHGVGIDAIFASPLARVIETAEPLAAARNLKISELDGLNELDYGEWQGITIDALTDDPYWHRYNEHRSLCRIPGGELLVEAQLRMVRTIEQLQRTRGDERLALFGHADPIRTLLLYALGMPLDFVPRLHVAPASVSIVQVTHGHARVTCINHTATLDDTWC
jgi:broad specificity phosphatase PhoE